MQQRAVVALVAIRIYHLSRRPVGMQLFFTVVLFQNRHDLRLGQARTRLAKATRFLTGGYRKELFFWELIELFRRIAISGWVRAAALYIT